MRVEDFGGKENVKGIIKLSKQTISKGIKITLSKRPPTKHPLNDYNTMSTTCTNIVPQHL